MLPKKLQKKLEQRKESNAYRALGTADNLIDFSSNDYLGFASSKMLFKKTHRFLVDEKMEQNGATGSRLLSGNHSLYSILEDMLCHFHKADAALVFNSGYDANVGFFSAVAQRNDVILYDEFSHASIRDGIMLSQAKSNKFKHNNLVDLERLLSLKAQRTIRPEDTIYVVTESIFSMDGDAPDIALLVKLCQKYNARLVVDEAHAVGVIGNKGEGMVQLTGLQHAIFARIITFGKALGCHGAAILGSKSLKEYLVNFSRSLIYTTALSPHILASVYQAYEMLDSEQIEKLKQNITYFNQLKTNLKLEQYFIESNSAIHCCIVSGNENVIAIANAIQKAGFSIKPIRYPTVAKGKERLRICLHSFNTKEQIHNLLKSIQKNG